MKKTFFTFIILLTSILSWGQVTTNPTFITQVGGSFDIIYDASAGSAGLKGLTTGVYAHIGVITSASTSISDWKYVLTPWPTSATDTKANISKNMLTNIGTNLWKLTIGPNIQTFLGVPATETIKQIALVFRNAAGTLTGKTAAGSDIFVNVYQAGLNVAFTSPSADGVTTAGTTMPIKIASSVNATLKININGVDVKTSTTDSTTLTTTYTFTNATDYTLIGSATASGTTVYDTAYICVPAPVTTQARPAGLKDGINYIDNTTVTLILLAPGKSNVFLIGDFNNWLQLNAYQMKKDGDYWWITLTGLTPGKMYGFQYLVDNSIRSSDPYTELVLDPWNDQWINQYYTIFPNLKPYPVGKTTGLVATLQTAKTAYNWQFPNFTVTSNENLLIYEMLLRDFTKEKSLDAAILKLDYLKNLGITAVELMPVQEFDGNNSWGYNPNHYFAPDKAYGAPETYKKFIDECHKRGIAVILDMVFNQASGLCPFALLYWDAAHLPYPAPAANNPWMNVTAPHGFSVLNDFNHSYTGTKEYFKRVLQYWLTEYKVDGYRMDLSKGFTQNSGTESTWDQQRINNLNDYYTAVKSTKGSTMFILEHFVGGSEEDYLASQGMYLWRNMNSVYSQTAMGYPSSSDMSGMISSPRQWVGYAESHDEERNFFQAKTNGAGSLKTDSIARINRVPLNIAFITLLPGPKMIYEFGEMGFDYSINSNGGRTNEKQPAWNWLSLPLRKAADDASAKIMTLRKMYPNVFTQGTYSINVGANDWSQGRRISIVHNDLDVVVLGNFDPTNTVSSNPTFPKTGVWYNYMTGDAFPVSNPYMTISMTPGQLLIFTDRQVTLPNGISTPKYNSDCTIYPTATNGLVYVSSPNLVQNVQVYNMQGMVVLSNSNMNSKEIDLSKMMNGLYIMEVTTLQGKSRYKIIKD